MGHFFFAIDVVTSSPWEFFVVVGMSYTSHEATGGSYFGTNTHFLKAKNRGGPYRPMCLYIILYKKSYVGIG